MDILDLFNLLEKIGIKVIEKEEGFIDFIDMDSSTKMSVHQTMQLKHDTKLTTKEIKRLSDFYETGILTIEGPKKKFECRLCFFGYGEEADLFDGPFDRSTLYTEDAKYIITKDNGDIIEHTVKINSHLVFSGQAMFRTSYKGNDSKYKFTVVRIDGGSRICFETSSSHGVFDKTFSDQWPMKAPEMLEIVNNDLLIKPFADYISTEYPGIKDTLDDFQTKGKRVVPVKEK